MLIYYLLRSLLAVKKHAQPFMVIKNLDKHLRVFYVTLMPYYSYFHIAPWVTWLFLFIQEAKLTGRGFIQSLVLKIWHLWIFLLFYNRRYTVRGVRSSKSSPRQAQRVRGQLLWVHLHFFVFTDWSVYYMTRLSNFDVVWSLLVC